MLWFALTRRPKTQAYVYHPSVPAIFGTGEAFTILTEENATAWGQVLLNENVRSVDERYPNAEERPGPIDLDLTYQYRPIRDVGIDYQAKCMAVVNATYCYDYQACETAGWGEVDGRPAQTGYFASLACAMVEGIRKMAVQALLGYERAPWGVSYQGEGNTNIGALFFVRAGEYADEEKVEMARRDTLIAEAVVILTTGAPADGQLGLL
jgi:hypothetical protein